MVRKNSRMVIRTRKNKRDYDKNNNNNNNEKKENFIPKDDEVEDGEIIEELPSDNINIKTEKDGCNNNDNEIQQKNNNANNNNNSNDDSKGNSDFIKPPPRRNYFMYKRNNLYDDLIKSEKIKELNVLLQSFRYFLDEKII